MIQDQTSRQEATDPRHSYIVQAPAGSGKTEILTQRYLRLLGHVEAPEQIIAITFTRKAANEMRERIVLALQNAAKGIKPTSPHQQQTIQFATKALQQDQKYRWQLIQQPNRLSIMTIDALCQKLARAMPLHEQHVPYADISNHPKSHYITAARACLMHAVATTDYHGPLTTLLHHVDNRHDRLITLLSELLTQREQWLPLLYALNTDDPAEYEDALASMVQHELQRLQKSLPNDLTHELITLTRELALLENNPESPRYPLQEWYRFDQMDTTIAAALATLLLTSQHQYRKRFDHHVGLKRGVCPNDVYDHLKTASQSLLSALEQETDFLEALLRVRHLPQPRYSKEQWDVLNALFRLLPLLAAHLHMTFFEKNEVDFSAISTQALQALGHDEQPTDLALYLDNNLHHLLVDEFQDTSFSQFQLLEKLVRGWLPNDGKTLFIVGDPMQSIYRFRAAEVGLFLRAQQNGIGDVTLRPLALTCNFRSTPTLVDWVNTQFKQIFPQCDDRESGAISFHASQSTQSINPNSHIVAEQYAHRIEEAQALVAHIKKQQQEHPTDTMAILVRSRHQLTAIIDVLKENNVPFQGVDIDLLANLPHIKDVWCITEALLMPANRLPWLAVLRSPWCGLSLSDIHRIAQYSPSESVLWALSQLQHIDGLSDEGRIRAHFIYTVLNDALAKRHQQPLIPWLINTLNALHLNAILTPNEQNDLEQYWQLIERFENKGHIEDREQFRNELNRLYSQHVVPSSLQIMTIHKSKGLEFDTVFLPGLGTRTPQSDKPMLRWLKLPSQYHLDLWLLSPIKAAHEEHDPLYDYLGRLDAEKGHYEAQRLLYVAVTRARKRLYLLDHGEKVTQNTFRSLLKHQPFITHEQATTPINTETPLPPLHRLPITFYQNNYQNPIPYQAHPIILQNHAPRLIGIAVHELLQWICNNHPRDITDIPWHLAINQLKTLGLEGKELGDAEQHIKTQITRFFADPIGQWISKHHDDEHNEYEFLIHRNETVSTNIIDRTFREKEYRWIIDFKTGSDDGNAKAHHRQQLEQYSELFKHHTREQNIRCGLYYLNNNHWITWDIV